MHTLQNRWQVEGKCLVYYGMRSGKNLFRNRLRLSKKQRAILTTLPRQLTPREEKALGSLRGVAVVTEDKKQLRRKICARQNFAKPALPTILSFPVCNSTKPAFARCVKPPKKPNV